MKKISAVILCLGLLMAGTAARAADFRFEDIKTLDDMRVFIERNYPLGSSRADVRAAFVTQGHAKGFVRTSDRRTEKYLYDINLCDLYIWRWNISADYDDGGHLLQAYVNGRRVFMSGKPAPQLDYEDGAHTAVIEAMRSRPEAVHGESRMPYTAFDRDGNPRTTDDQFVTGYGHAAADPKRLDESSMYKEVELWRSIFDRDEAPIVPYDGFCNTSPKPKR